MKVAFELHLEESTHFTKHRKISVVPLKGPDKLALELFYESHNKT